MQDVTSCINGYVSHPDKRERDLYFVGGRSIADVLLKYDLVNYRQFSLGQYQYEKFYHYDFNQEMSH